MSTPTDEQILAALRECGHGMTYVVTNRLRRNFHPLKTAFVLRRLKALETAGKVKRVPTDYAVQICWVAAEGAGDHASGGVANA
jgi:Fe2+ or Zn2+ uptake regulation protein